MTATAVAVADRPTLATRREWIGLAVLALACLLYRRQPVWGASTIVTVRSSAR